MSKSKSRKADDVATEIRAELRSILRMRDELYTPVQEFIPFKDDQGHVRYYVRFDTKPHIKIKGMKCGMKELQLPDERISDRVNEFAKAVWHLKDRLHQYAKATGQQVDCDAYSKQSAELLICADLANKKKHGRNENRSGSSPTLDTVKFDVSESGGIEFYYNGATKDKELIVEQTVPIPFVVSILDRDNAVIGDARDTIDNGFNHWLPLIFKLRVLCGSDPESKALREILLPGT